MKKVALGFIFMIFTFLVFAQENIKNEGIYLIIRSDDIGSFHAANVGCIETYQKGITQSVELMAPCPWFFEAVEMLNKNPKLDVGIHLTLTSEWSLYKWGPLTNCPGLTDDAGKFFPMVWKNSNFPANSSIQESNWNIQEIENELRAQIELSLKYVPRCSHLSSHMGFGSLDPKINKVVSKLAKEYNLEVDVSDVKRFQHWNNDLENSDRIFEFCESLENLTAGKYLFVEHPSKDFPEMKPVGHTGNTNVAEERDFVTTIFTSEKVKQTIKNKGIKLISYSDLKRLNQ